MDELMDASEELSKEIKACKAFMEEDNTELALEPVTSNNKFYNNAAILFRNRIYRLIHSSYDLYFIHDYYESKSYYNLKKNENITYNNIAFLHLNERKLDNNISNNEFKSVTYDIFESEAENIAHEDVDKRMLECIKRIQESKIATEIPYHKIREHEEYHMNRLKAKINKYIASIIRKIFDGIHDSKKLIETIITYFQMSEYDLERDVDILYDYPNADGIKRGNYMDYMYYLFEKMHPRPSEEVLTSKLWFHHKIYELLCETYPCLNITFRPDKCHYYIDLVHPKLLH